jgi:hypothetical protein
MSKYDIRKTSKLKFARFGGLSSVNQRGYKNHPKSFHSPPAHRGFYAFVWPYYEFFLLGAPETDDPKVPGSKFSYVRDDNGDIITDKHPEYEALTERWKCWSVDSSEYTKYKKDHYPEGEPDYEASDTVWNAWRPKRDAFYTAWEKTGPPRSVLVTKPHPRIFTHTGQLWHHLESSMSPGRILGRHGSWVKSDVNDYRDALEKEMHAARRDTVSIGHSTFKEFGGNDSLVNTYFSPNSKNPFRNYDKCMLEVFIEKL